MITNCKLTVLAENKTTQTKYKVEHGLSLLIQADNNSYIFDTGKTNLFQQNALIMNKSLSEIDGVILSHSHYDHTGGLEFLYNKQVYLHSSFFNKKHKKINGKNVFIGIRYIEKHYKNRNNLHFNYIKDNNDLANNIKIISNFKNNDAQDYFYVQKGSDIIKDTFEDELVMTIKTDKGLIIITGCSHNGIIPIIKKCIAEANSHNIYALIGGFHLSKLKESEVKKIAAQIDKFKIQNIGISHCTGDALIKYLSHGNVFNFNTGDIFTINE